MNTPWEESAEPLQLALDLLGRTLSDRGLSYAIAVAGGAALMMHGNITRPTQDVDVVSVATEQTWSVSYALPQPLQEAVEDVAQVLDLPRDWLNTGALGIVAERLPDGFTDRLHSLTYHNLVVCVLDREDLLKLKVWAAADEGPFSRHTHDIRAIGPTAAELEIAFKWAAVHARASAADIEIIAQALAGAN